MQALLRIGLFCIIMSLSLIAFGQADSLRIKPPFRYIEKGDTFTVFTLKDERAIAYKIKKGEDCEETVVVADSALRSADSIIAGKTRELKDLELQKQNLNEQVSTKIQTEKTYKVEINEKDKQNSLLKRQIIIFKITTGILAASTIYFIIK